MNNDFKTQLQQKAFAALKDEHRVILKWATGCGKSKMAIDLVNHAYTLWESHNYKRTVLFLVAERAHIKNWKQEFEKWNLNPDFEVDILCYASLKKVKNMSYDIIVMDEVHHVFSEKRMAILETLQAHFIYLLSATLPSSKQDLIEDLYGKFKVYTVSLKEAIQNDILPKPKVYVVCLELNNTTATEEIKINGADAGSPIVKWEDRMKYIAKKLPCIIRCTERQKYIYYTDNMEYWKRRYELSHNQFQHNLWVNMGSVRKRYLGELKTKHVYKLFSLMPRNKRYVCFCASVNQADMLSSANTISSRKGSKKNQHIIDMFNAKKINSIYAVGMITEGMNLTDIQMGIIVQLDGKERLFIQKFGRSLRAEDPVSFIFYYKDTQDEVYLKNALENIDDKFIKHINFNQLQTIKL